MSGQSRKARDGFRGCAELRGAIRVSRRRVLQAGTLGWLGLGLADYLARPALAGESQRLITPTAKRCIFIFMWGGPSHLDTFDLKPEAPAEVRGEFRPIATNVAGIQICEHFKQLARHADKLAVIRSLNHSDPAHLSSGHATLTGQWAPVRNSDAEPPSDRDNPHIGAVMARLRPAEGALPSAVTMPWLAFHPAAPGGEAPGQHAGFLGKRYEPFLIKGDPNDAKFRIKALELPGTVTAQRLASRRELLGVIDRQRAALEQAGESAAMNQFQQQAFSLLASPAAREAFDISAEPTKVRDRYGRNIHGQCVLLARRLVERGVPLVSINWHNDGRNFWDTHGNNFNRLKNDLIPPADRALSALLEDLDERGLLDETIVAWVGEFGRRPRITAGNAGREHWPWCYNGLLAGGGIRGGTLYGASDAQGMHPADLPVSPLDYAATLYHALGIRPEATLPDSLNRPRHLCGGKPILPLFG